MKRLLIAFGLALVSLISEAQQSSAKKPQMQFMGAFDAGQPDVSIYKMFDPTEDVVCYLLMPEASVRRQGESGKWLYDGNTIGSISCMKVKLPVVPVVGAEQQQGKKR